MKNRFFKRMAFLMATLMLLLPMMSLTVLAANPQFPLDEVLTLATFEEDESIGLGRDELDGGANGNASTLALGYSSDYKCGGSNSLTLSVIDASANAFDGFHFSMFDQNGDTTGDNTSNWEGARYIQFWAKNSGKKAVDIAFQLYEGAVVNGANAMYEPWQIKGSANTSGTMPAVYYLEDAKGTQIISGQKLQVPADFEGMVRIPLTLDNFENPIWYNDASHKNGKMDLACMTQCNVYFENCQNFTDGILYLDNFAVGGWDLAEVASGDLLANKETLKLATFEDDENIGLGRDELDGGANGNASTLTLGYSSDFKYSGTNSMTLKILDASANVFDGFHFSMFDNNADVTGDNTSNWQGAEYVRFWAKNSGQKAVDIGLQLYEGAVVNGANAMYEPWQIKATGNTTGVMPAGYYLVDSKGAVKVSNQKLQVPAGFEGLVVVPLNISNFETPTWYSDASHKNGQLDLECMTQFNVFFENCQNFTDDTLYLDDFAVGGSDLAEVIPAANGESDTAAVDEGATPEDTPAENTNTESSTPSTEETAIGTTDSGSTDTAVGTNDAAEPVESKNPSTGDAGAMIFAFMAAGSGLGAAAYKMKRK